MKSLSSKVFKNYQVNVGIPIQIRPPINFPGIKGGGGADKNSGSADDLSESPEELQKSAEEEAEMIIKEAQIEALRIVENAEQEMQQARIKVEEEAWQKGYEDGYHEAKKQYEDLIQEAEITRDRAHAEHQDVLARIESDAVDLVMEIARKVIGAQISFNKEDILYLIQQAFNKCTNKEYLVLKVAPEDYNYVVENRDKLLAMAQGVGELEIKRDSSLEEGSCIVETPYGSIDAGASTKLKKMEEAFRQVIGK